MLDFSLAFLGGVTLVVDARLSARVAEAAVEDVVGGLFEGDGLVYVSTAYTATDECLFVEWCFAYCREG